MSNQKAYDELLEAAKQTAVRLDNYLNTLGPGLETYKHLERTRMALLTAIAKAEGKDDDWLFARTMLKGSKHE